MAGHNENGRPAARSARRQGSLSTRAACNHHSECECRALHIPGRRFLCRRLVAEKQAI